MQIEGGINLQCISLTELSKEPIHMFFSRPLFYPTSLGIRLATTHMVSHMD